DRPAGGGRVAGDRRPDPVRESEERPLHDIVHPEDGDHRYEIAHSVNKRTSSASINRSESYKERVHNKKSYFYLFIFFFQREIRERRKTSDPNLSKSRRQEMLLRKVPKQTYFVLYE
ncbi:hypothetical protein L9F63_003367, partial [Diploptera punctata]